MIYNHKDIDQEIQTYIFNDLNEFVDDVRDEYNKLRRYETIAIYTTYEEINMFLMHYYKENIIDYIYCVLSELENIYNPNKMGILTITFDGKCTIQDAFYNNKIVYSEAVLLYLNDNYTPLSASNLLEDKENILHYYFKGDTD